MSAAASPRDHGTVDDCDAGSVTHHCHIVETGNKSYRFLHSTAVAKKRIKAREQARRSGFHPRFNIGSAEWVKFTEVCT